MDWMLTRCEEVDEEGLSGNEADSEDEGYNDEIADPDNLLLNMVCCLICIWSVVFQQYAYFKNIFSFSVQCPCYVVWKLTPCVHLNVTTIKRYLLEQWSFNLKKGENTYPNVIMNLLAIGWRHAVCWKQKQFFQTWPHLDIERACQRTHLDQLF